MKRIIISSTAALLALGALSGCAAGEVDRPAPQAKPSGITNVTTENLYNESSADDNYITHWVFKQDMPDGTTITCVAARYANSSNIAISCPSEEKK